MSHPRQKVCPRKNMVSGRSKVSNILFGFSVIAFDCIRPNNCKGNFLADWTTLCGRVQRIQARLSVPPFVRNSSQYCFISSFASTHKTDPDLTKWAQNSFFRTLIILDLCFSFFLLVLHSFSFKFFAGGGGGILVLRICCDCFLLHGSVMATQGGGWHFSPHYADGRVLQDN